MKSTFEYVDKYFKKEHFTNNPISDSTIAPYYEENRLYVYEPPYSTNAVNISSDKNLNFKFLLKTLLYWFLYLQVVKII